MGNRVLCRHPFQESKRAWVIPSKVEELYKVCWQNGQIQEELLSMEAIRETVQQSLSTLRQDSKRSLNPTPYKASTSTRNAVMVVETLTQ